MAGPTLVWRIIFIIFHTPLCTWYCFWSVFSFTGLSIPIPVQIVLISGYLMEFWGYGFVPLSCYTVTYWYTRKVLMLVHFLKQDNLLNPIVSNSLFLNWVDTCKRALLNTSPSAVRICYSKKEFRCQRRSENSD